MAMVTRRSRRGSRRIMRKIQRWFDWSRWIDKGITVQFDDRIRDGRLGSGQWRRSMSSLGAVSGEDPCPAYPMRLPLK